MSDGRYVEQARAQESPWRPRQLENLTDLPTPEDPRPTFFMSATPPRNAGNLMRTTEFPKLLWRIEDDHEVTVHTEDEERRLLHGGYTSTPPVVKMLSPTDIIRAKMAALDPEEREQVIAAQRDDRLRALQAELAALSDEAREAVLGERAVEVPVKRGPGRPPKER